MRARFLTQSLSLILHIHRLWFIILPCSIRQRTRQRPLDNQLQKLRVISSGGLIFPRIQRIIVVGSAPVGCREHGAACLPYADDKRVAQRLEPATVRGHAHQRLQSRTGRCLVFTPFPHEAF